MSRKQEANAHGLPREGQPLLYRRRQQVTPRQSQEAPQVTWTAITPIPGDRPTLFAIQPRSPTMSCTGRGSQEDGHSVPHSRVTGPRRLSVSDLPPLHGPQLTLAPPRQLSGQWSRASTDCVKLPPLPATAASGSFPRGTARTVGAAFGTVKLPPLPAAPAAAASGSSPRGTARPVGPMARGQPECVPPPPWGTLAAGRAQGTPSLERRMEGLWRGSAARQSHHLPPVTPARSVSLCTQAQPGWERLGRSEMEELTEVQAGHCGSIFKDPYRGLGTYLLEDRSMVSTCTRQKSDVSPEMDVEPQGLPRACRSTKGCTEKAAECSQLLCPAQVAEQSPTSGNSTPWDTPVKQLEEEWEEEEVPEAQAEGEWDSDLQNMFLSILKEAEVEEEVCALAGDPWEERHSKRLLTSESEESSNFSASPLSGVPDEERAACWAATHAALQKQLCMGLQIMQKKREELEKLVEEEVYAELFGDILSSISSEESPMMSSCDLRDASSASLESAADPSVPLSPCSVAEEAAGETQSCSELVSPELLADLGSDSEDSLSLETALNELLEKWEQEEAAGEWDTDVKSPLSILPQDEDFKPSPTPPDSDLIDQGHSEPLPRALPQEPEGFVGCTSPGDAMEDAEAAGMEAGSAQDAPPQEKPCGDEPPPRACPVPAQPLARSVPACPAGSAAVPQPPAPRPWRSMAKRARRALRRLFSFGCLRGQPEE